MHQPVEKPRARSPLRYKLAQTLHTWRRYVLWLTRARCFAVTTRDIQLPHVHAEHATILLRRLKEVDMQWQRNKVVNLRLAVEKLDGVLVRPGEVLSYWRLIGRPTYRKGYLDGVALKGGKVVTTCGGGLCQLSNLIYWMTLHTPLTVVERHRHGYDVFPDSSRTQPFGSGATCFYPYGDLMIKNKTDQSFQLRVHVGADELEGQWRAEYPPDCMYEIVEKNHCFAGEYWGGFSRHNELYRNVYDLDGRLLHEEYVTENHALMMYTPFIDQSEAVSPHE